jgi:glycosyltransferase involved in cell wall biosynthesis
MGIHTNHNLRFQFVSSYGRKDGAGGKAPNDVRIIAKQLGFAEIQLPPRNAANLLSRSFALLHWFVKCALVCFKFPPQGEALVQYPSGFMAGHLGLWFLKVLKKARNARIITVIHDLDSVRSWAYDDNWKALPHDEFAELNSFSDVIISHNEFMSELLRAKGVSCGIIDLQVFDYLLDKPVDSRIESNPDYRSVVVAGGLGIQGREYLRKLANVPGVFWHLYGTNFDDAAICGPNIQFFGAHEADQLPSVLNGSWGLVWDGDSAETCSSWGGRYLKVNNPHKLSLYIASQLPVIVWDKSAEAGFVRQEGIGLLVSSLLDIPQTISGVNAEIYKEYLTNVRRLSQQVCSGFFMEKALTNAESLLLHLSA